MTNYSSLSDDEIYHENLRRFMFHLYFQRVICERSFDDLLLHASESRKQTDFTYANDCWIWNGPIFIRKKVRDRDRKQPRLSIIDPVTRKHKSVYARRFAWEQVYGGLDGKCLGLYRCGEDLCVNPGHAVQFTAGTLYQVKGELEVKKILEEKRIMKANGVDVDELDRVLEHEIEENERYKQGRKASR